MKIISLFLVACITIVYSEVCTVSEFGEVQNAVQTCKDIILDNLFVPGGEALKLPLQDGTRVTFRGNTTFGHAVWAGPLVEINGTNIQFEGEDRAIIDGQGQLYWDGKGGWGDVKPSFFTVQLHNSSMKNINVLNTPKDCVLLTDSTNVELSNWTIDDSAGDQDKAPGKYGHNTDGFDVFNSTDVIIRDAVVYNQDDCVAVRSGNNITIENFYCHGGHGLSISAGWSNDSFFLNTLTNVNFRNSLLEEGQNAIHIKTHIDAGRGLMENITYENITFSGMINNGINIQQNYKNIPPNSTMPSVPDNNIPIKNLELKNIHGSVKSSAYPVYILCVNEGCFNWNFFNVSVEGTKTSSCNYSPSNFTC
uniref:endo-polygalacturonase n=1 Tax=Sitophilus oryzae TaxID=7048 RepID=E7CIP5_SITOR|nr:endopolygalacturonase [Sitophilus oryzae]